MSIERIEQLRKERKGQVKAIKSKINKIKDDEKYSPEYKMQQEAELKRELESVRQNYDSQITELINNSINESERNFYNAEFDGMKEVESTQALIKEMRDQEEAELIAKRFKDNHKGLYDESEKLVSVNSPKAIAHIKALKKLGAIGAESLEKQYKEQNLNDKQKMYKEELDKLEEQRKLYEVEKTEDNDPFKAALMEKVYFGE